MLLYADHLRSAENGASGIVPSAAEMWAMAQQMVNRSPGDTGFSNTGASTHNRPERPQSSSSEVELTNNKADVGQGIVKTIKWETSTDLQPDTSSNNSNIERHSRIGF